MTGALLVPSALAVIVHVFPDERRASAVGRWAAWSGVSAVIGPVVGGWLVDTASWRLVFAVNVPFVVVTVLLVLRAVPARPRRRSRAARRRGRRPALRAGTRRPRLRAHRGAVARLERPGRRRRLRRRPAAAGRVPVVGAARTGPDAAARPLPPPRVQRGQRLHARHLRRARPRGLLPDALPAGGGRLQRARGRTRRRADEVRPDRARIARRAVWRASTARGRSSSSGRSSSAAGRC